MNYLRDYRIKKLMMQKKLAAASGVSQVTISFIENQLSEPMELTKGKLARALGVPIEKIFPIKDRRKGKLMAIRKQVVRALNEARECACDADEKLGQSHWSYQQARGAIQAYEWMLKIMDEKG